MKKLLFTILTIAIVGSAKSQFQKAELQASGLTCSMCSNAINKALKGLNFVESVDTDLNNNTFNIHFKPGTAPDFDQLKMKVEGAGFSVANLWVHTNFKDLSIKNDEHTTVNGVTLHFVNVKNQVLNSNTKIKIIDKSFVTSKEYKKMNTLTAMECYKTGFMDECCNLTKKGSDKKRIFHVTI